jgi:hypothetical protein
MGSIIPLNQYLIRLTSKALVSHKPSKKVDVQVMQVHGNTFNGSHKGSVTAPFIMLITFTNLAKC